MKVLLDTHILIWLIRDPALLSSRETKVVLDGDNVLLLSVVSIWELRIKWNIQGRDGRRKGALDPVAALNFATAQGIQVHPLAPADCIAALVPPLEHKDHFDEMLLTHAQQLGARLLTRDGRLAGHPVALIA